MALTLDDAEQRILGVLMEKCLSQPGSYPLTLNMIVLGANQKQNRDPVVEFPERELARALHSLQTRNLVGQARSAIGARANRFEHRVVEQLGWDRREQAVMAELMLRGRQTVGELRTRASRMTPFSDLASVMATLDVLAGGDTAYVEELEREPGRSTTRFRHLVCSAAPRDGSGAPDGSVVESVAEAVVAPVSSEPGEPLAERVAALERRVAELSRDLDAIKKREAVAVDAGESPPV